jgi:hypothetical protein
MNDAFCVGGVQRIGDLNAKVKHQLKCERLFADPVLQRLAFEQLHAMNGMVSPPSLTTSIS